MLAMFAPLKLHPTKSALVKFTPERSAFEKLEYWNTPFFKFAPLTEIFVKL